MLKKYLIEKWEIKKAGDVAFSPVLDSAYVNGVNDKSVIQLTVDKDAEVKVMLKPFMHVLCMLSSARLQMLEVARLKCMRTSWISQQWEVGNLMKRMYF